jgi:hypothetical protein
MLINANSTNPSPLKAQIPIAAKPLALANPPGYVPLAMAPNLAPNPFVDSFKSKSSSQSNAKSQKAAAKQQQQQQQQQQSQQMMAQQNTQQRTIFLNGNNINLGSFLAAVNQQNQINSQQQTNANVNSNVSNNQSKQSLSEHLSQCLKGTQAPFQFVPLNALTGNGGLNGANKTGTPLIFGAQPNNTSVNSNGNNTSPTSSSNQANKSQMNGSKAQMGGSNSSSMLGKANNGAVSSQPTVYTATTTPDGQIILQTVAPSALASLSNGSSTGHLGHHQSGSF